MFELRMPLQQLLLCLCLISSALPSLSAGIESADSITVEVVGTLRTGVMAVGGETTGTTVTANNITWELDLNANPGAKKLAPQLDGQKVKVKGTYSRRRGVEVPFREIITVTALKPLTVN